MDWQSHIFTLRYLSMYFCLLFSFIQFQDDKQDRPRPAGASGREMRNMFKSLKRELDSSILFNFFVYADIKPANFRLWKRYSPLVHLKSSRWNKFNMKVIKSQHLNLTPQTFLIVCWGAIVVRETGCKRTEVEWNFKVNFFFGAVSSIFSGKLRELENGWSDESWKVLTGPQLGNSNYHWRQRCDDYILNRGRRSARTHLKNVWPPQTERWF